MGEWTDHSSTICVGRKDAERIEQARQNYVAIASNITFARQQGVPADYTEQDLAVAEEEYRRARAGAEPAPSAYFHRFTKGKRKR